MNLEPYILKSAKSGVIVSKHRSENLVLPSLKTSMYVAKNGTLMTCSCSLVYAKHHDETACINLFSRHL